MAQGPVKWSNLVGCNQSTPGGEPKSGGSRRVIPPEVRRKWANASTEGGTATCCKCHQRFAAYYVKECYVAPFRTDHVCNDCRKLYKLQVV